MFSLGGSEILVLAFIALILFGNKDLPANMKKLVKGLNEVKKVANDAQRSWAEVRDDVTRQIMADDAEEQAKKELAEIKRLIESNPIKESAETKALVGSLDSAHSDESGHHQGLLPQGHDAHSGEFPEVRPVAEELVERKKRAFEQDDNVPFYENPEDDPNYKTPSAPSVASNETGAPSGMVEGEKGVVGGLPAGAKGDVKV